MTNLIKKFLKNRKGFTLIELLAVVIVLAIILSIAIPGVTKLIVNSREKAYLRQTEVIETTSHLYFSQNPDAIFVSLLTLIDKGYLCDCVKDPRDGSLLRGYVIKVDGEYQYIRHGVYANKPVLEPNMYPIKFTGESVEIIEEDDSEWYGYQGDITNNDCYDEASCLNGEGSFTEEKWANVHISSDELEPGDIIDMDNANIYVWIPRYTYKMEVTPEEGYINTTTYPEAENISIQYTIGTKDNLENNYQSMSAFCVTNNDDNGDGNFNTILGDDCTDQDDWDLKGIWIAKFEMSASSYSSTDEYGVPSKDSYGVSIPNKMPWSTISISDAFNQAKAIKTELELSADTHLIKSSEWAAVAYLTEAIRDGEPVWSNNQGYYLGEEPDNTYLSTGCSAISYTENPTNQEECLPLQKYYEDASKASTTGNIYGIFDMVGGLEEYTATYINDNAESVLTNVNNISLYNAEPKYKDVINVSGEINTTNYTNAELLTNALALNETSKAGEGNNTFYASKSIFPYATYPIISRGGNLPNQNDSGLFSFYNNDGTAKQSVGWRAVLVN